MNYPFEPLEEEYHRRGYQCIAGIDEAGRGPLAGPVTISLVIFPPSSYNALPLELSSLNDSKKLSPKKREQLYPLVKKNALFHCTIHISSRRIDRIGINPAIEYAVERALHRAHLSGIKPDVILVDGNYKFTKLKSKNPDLEYRPVIGGDSKIMSIAGASILAKVSRDRRMIQYAGLFPGYGLDEHKGYGTAKHRTAIKELGPAPIHRRSYTW